MRKFLFTIIFGIISIAVIAQKNQITGENPLNIDSSPGVFIPLIIAPDFSVTFTDGTPSNLYTTLGSGKTVVLDFFKIPWGYCEAGAPAIEHAYQSYGAGTGNIEFWGIDYDNNDAEVDAYKAQNGVTNPCASGTQGNGNAVFGLFGNIQFPTYGVICPDKTLSLNINYPPSATGFDSYFANCSATSIDENVEHSKTMIIYTYPLPAKENLNVHIYADKHSQIKIELFNIIGNCVYTVSNEVEKGYYNLEIPVNNLAGGTYIIKLSHAENIMDIQKIIVMK